MSTEVNPPKPLQDPEAPQAKPVSMPPPPQAPKAIGQEHRPDVFKPQQGDRAYQARELAKKPAALGHKMPTSRQKQEAGPQENSYLRRLLGMRHHTEDRTQTYRILRHEIHRARLTKHKGEETKKTHQGHEAETFLKKTGKLLKTLGLTGSESNFEKKLKEALAGKRVVGDLAKGQKIYPVKTSPKWIESFQNLFQRGSIGQWVSRNLTHLKGADYRGLFQDPDQKSGKTLVADLEFVINDRTLRDRFARILVDHPELLDLLERHNPGDTLNKDVLSRLGDELKYLKLAHQTDHPSAEARDASAAALLNQLRSPISQEAMNRTEQSLVEERRRREQASSLLREQDADDEGKYPQPSFAWWEFGKLKARPGGGRPKLGIFITYFLSLIVFLLIFYAISRGL